MPDSFFTSNKSRKRKRAGPASSHSSYGGKKPRVGPKRTLQAANGRPAKKRDEELSEETSDDAEGIEDMDLRAPEVDPNAYDSDEEDEDETPAEKRLRLAKLYLEGVKQDLAAADGDFDAAEVDKELLSARLKQDVVAQSGKVHLFIADSYSHSEASVARTRGHRFSVTTAVASENARWLYTASKDGSIIKWDLHSLRRLHTFHKTRPPKDLGKGKGRADLTQDLRGHTDEIWTLALSSDGQLLASGGKDRRIGVWDVEKDEWVKGFTGHRDAISALAFRKPASPGSSQRHLYTGSYDRTVKLFDLSPNTMGYVETLFGHQAPVLALDTLMRETAVSVGGRDKSVRFWKIPEESQLVFRGGGRSGWEDTLEGGETRDGELDGRQKRTQEKFIEGSVDCVVMIDETTFVSGGDSGSVSLWSTHKKKAIFIHPVAHGVDESHVHTEDVEIVRKPRWITSLGCLRYSDLFASGSWDGEIRLWKLDPNLKSFSLLRTIPALGIVNSLQFLSIPEDQERSYNWVSVQAGGTHTTQRRTKPILLVAGVGKEPRLGRWVQKKDSDVLNGALMVALYASPP